MLSRNKNESQTLISQLIDCIFFYLYLNFQATFVINITPRGHTRHRHNPTSPTSKFKTHNEELCIKSQFKKEHKALPANSQSLQPCTRDGNSNNFSLGYSNAVFITLF